MYSIKYIGIINKHVVIESQEQVNYINNMNGDDYHPLRSVDEVNDDTISYAQAIILVSDKLSTELKTNLES